MHLVNQRKSRLLPQEDEDLTSFIEHNFERSGVDVMNNVELNALTVVGDKGVEVKMSRKAKDSDAYVPMQPFTVLCRFLLFW